jgi:hypothetical protein
MSFFKSDTQPLCRCCGKPIRKWTDNVWGNEMKKAYRSKDEVQRDRNDVVTSVAYCTIGDESTRQYDHFKRLGAKPGDRVVDRFFVWDGVSYEDEFFCSTSCASRFAYMVAHTHPEIETKAYQAANRKRMVKQHEKLLTGSD